MKTLLAVILAALLMGCTDAPGAQRALENAGYKEVRITGYEWLGCGKDDLYSTGFEATGLTGKKVSGVVCSSLGKSSTIRTD